jgi:hypothetical protein
MAYETIAGPLGPERGDYHAAQIAAAVLNAARGKRGRVAQIKDLLIKWDAGAGRRPAQDPHEMLRAVKAINRAMGGAEVTEGGTDVDDSRRTDRQGRRRHRRR